MGTNIENLFKAIMGKRKKQELHIEKKYCAICTMVQIHVRFFLDYTHVLEFHGLY